MAPVNSSELETDFLAIWFLFLYNLYELLHNSLHTIVLEMFP